MSDTKVHPGNPESKGNPVPQGAESLQAEVTRLREALGRALEHVGPCYCNRKFGYRCEICDIRKDAEALAQSPTTTESK